MEATSYGSSYLGFWVKGLQPGGVVEAGDSPASGHRHCLATVRFLLPTPPSIQEITTNLYSPPLSR